MVLYYIEMAALYHAPQISRVHKDQRNLEYGMMQDTGGELCVYSVMG